LADSVCEAIVEHYFFANARQNLVTEQKIADHERARQWQERIERLVRPDSGRVAEQLTRRPDANGLRAPARNVPRVPTNVLLEEDLLPSQARSTG